MKKKRFLILYLGWGTVILITYFLTISFSVNFSKQIVEASSRAFFQELVATRLWNSSHGGVYVVVSDSVQPNPYLEDSLRDLTATNGIELTKINPAYMTREISEITREKSDIKYHITSLNPIRPKNMADDWERKTLESFEQGVPEKFELVDMDTVKVFRYMAPLMVESSCLKCHAKQGYSLGQIRGGISITSPSSDFFYALNQIIITRSVIFLILLLTGFTGLFYFQRMVNNQFLISQIQNSILTRNNLEKDRLFSIVAHDLRSPISGIHGLSQILLNESETIPPEEKIRIIGSIVHSSDNLLKLSEHLIQWYQTRKGILAYKPEYFNMEAIVEEVVDFYAEKAEKKHISVTTSIPVGFQVYCDLNMIETIFRNLLGNALKFTPHEGFIEISAKDNTPDQDFIEVSVKDTGVGMDQQTIARLFKEDITPSRPGTEQEEGTGLGLSICHEFILKNHGTIRVESTPDVGTSFIMTLPKKPQK